MSFKIYKDENLILVDYEPQNGAGFLFEIFGIEIDETNKIDIEKELEENQKKIKNGDFSQIGDLFKNNFGPKDYIKNGIRLLGETLSPVIFQRSASHLNRATFILGSLDEEIDYYRIPKYLLTAYRKKGYVAFDVLIHKDVEISKDLFFHDSSQLYFEIIDLIKPEDQIIIGGDREDSIPYEDFKNILTKLPTRTGYQHYMRAQIEKCFSGYFDVKEDYIQKYKKYLNKKSQGKGFQFIEDIGKFEEQKYRFILERLNSMLDGVEGYSESKWQMEILEIVLILFPKYTNVLSEVLVRTPEGKQRRIDFGLIDSDGHLDLIEIKQPFDDCLITKRPNRNNYVPVRELSTTIVQAEKYIYYLNKWGNEGEKVLTRKFQEKLNKTDLSVRITNPKAILILGRDYNLSQEQRNDLEVIKRQYSNIADIITYDDLLRRLNSLVLKFST
ncbi:Shedu immune nuclease family protein [Halobacteriovorax sp. XZX-3]|uniref:Shedu immune nuclease family protein n=1 Tax=unclassified Halobacteriovorax TaxID=2639665 RepID=UPI003720423B